MPNEPLFYQSHVFVCTNRRPPGSKRGSCAEKDSEKLRDYMKSRSRELGIEHTRINAAGCLDRCELGPTLVVYPEGVWYSFHSTADIDEILETHLIQGGRVERLLLKADQRPPGK